MLLPSRLHRVYRATAKAARGGQKKEKAKVKVQLQDPGAEYKQVLVVREDLRMGRGKVAAQCCHASIGAFKRLWRRRDAALLRWDECGQTKVVLGVGSLEELHAILAKAQELGVGHYLVSDAGRTQVEPGTQTVLAVGPAPVSTVNSVTGHLKLLP